MNRLLPAHIFKRGQSYAVRYNVPKDLQETLGKREIVRGLGTRDLADAVACPSGDLSSEN